MFLKRELMRWWSSFSFKDQDFIKGFIRDATTLFHTSLDWSPLEAIAIRYDLSLRCVTIGDEDLLPTIEEYDRFFFYYSFGSSLLAN